MKPEAVFILYGGSSEDGRGSGKFKGSTYDAQEALDFFYKYIAGNNYSTGYIEIVTDVDHTTVHSKSNLSKITKYL